MSVKVGINGFGRIGKLVFRFAFENPDIEIVHINDKMETDLMAHLLKYDSLHGRFKADVSHDEHNIIVNGKKILVTNSSHATEIPWEQSNVDIVVDASGKFLNKHLLEGHLQHGVKKVILSSPSGDNSIERTIVMGINQHEILPTDTIISNASCTTNCVSMMIKVLQDEFGIKRAFMNTVHPSTNNQNIQDGYHTDFRRARSATKNIIPTTTSAIKTTQLIFPSIKGKFDGFATRVPVVDCSFVELTAEIGKKVNVEDVNNAFKRYAEKDLKNYLEYCTDPIVSSDISNNHHSAIFDSLVTKVLLDDMIQILAWYDNESGYSARIVDLIKYIS
ncbi:MAG: type I glyceraldehyde-3-phosphate dehydrogenase [Salinivirgaceae bacterium]|nr:type I glyceraldehyde-3-phosphate dehydrogenase [Salinivirgaceae bacterium]